MINKPFDPTKPVQTRDGRKARIICTDARGAAPIVALISTTCIEEEEFRFDMKGQYLYGPSLGGMDLINIPARIHRKVWVNVYDNGTVSIHTFLPQTSAFCLACIPITIDCEEGEGLGEREGA